VGIWLTRDNRSKSSSICSHSSDESVPSGLSLFRLLFTAKSREMALFDLSSFSTFEELRFTCIPGIFLLLHRDCFFPAYLFYPWILVPWVLLRQRLLSKLDHCKKECSTYKKHWGGGEVLSFKNSRQVVTRKRGGWLSSSGLGRELAWEFLR